jgi:hypothetical protein
LVRETTGGSARVLEEQALEQDGEGYSVDIFSSPHLDLLHARSLMR